MSLKLFEFTKKYDLHLFETQFEKTGLIVIYYAGKFDNIFSFSKLEVFHFFRDFYIFAVWS